MSIDINYLDHLTASHVEQLRLKTLPGINVVPEGDPLLPIGWASELVREAPVDEAKRYSGIGVALCPPPPPRSPPLPPPPRGIHRPTGQRPTANGQRLPEFGPRGKGPEPESRRGPRVQESKSHLSIQHVEWGRYGIDPVPTHWNQIHHGIMESWMGVCPYSRLAGPIWSVSNWLWLGRG